MSMRSVEGNPSQEAPRAEAARKGNDIEWDDARSVAAANEAALQAAHRHELRRRLERLMRASGARPLRKS